MKGTLPYFSDTEHDCYGVYDMGNVLEKGTSHFVKIIRHDISIVEKHMGDMAAKHLYDDNTDEDEAKED